MRDLHGGKETADLMDRTGKGGNMVPVEGFWALEGFTFHKTLELGNITAMYSHAHPTPAL